jgi:SP family arabinose:H+ symporter-like MFS transporter
MAALKMGVAQTPRQLIEGRSIMGVAIGLASIVGPVYIAESAPNSIRAMMVVMYAIEIGVGTVRSQGGCPRSAAWQR